jgi:hypothetical protein
MKTNELRDILKVLVEEEVQKQLPKLLFEMLDLKSKPILKEQTEFQAAKRSEQLHNNVVVQPPVRTQVSQQPRVMKKYTNNPMLNQILNETTPGLPQTQYGSSLVELSDGGFGQVGGDDQSQMINENIQYSDYQPQETAPSPAPLNIFNRDFKAILEKSKKIKPI